MSAWVLVDSSAWSHALRPTGDRVVRERVHQLLQDQDAAWCDMVRLELWSGVRNDKDRDVLLRLDGTLPRLPISDEIWENAVAFASKARASGVTVPAADLLIFACARHYGVSIEHRDRHYDLPSTLKS